MRMTLVVRIARGQERCHPRRPDGGNGSLGDNSSWGKPSGERVHRCQHPFPSQHRTWTPLGMLLPFSCSKGGRSTGFWTFRRGPTLKPVIRINATFGRLSYSSFASTTTMSLSEIRSTYEAVVSEYNQ